MTRAAIGTCPQNQGLVLVTRPGQAGQDLAVLLSSHGFDAQAWSPFALVVDPAKLRHLVTQVRDCLQQGLACSLVLVSPTIARVVAGALSAGGPLPQGSALTVMTPGSGSLRAFAQAMLPAIDTEPWQTLCPPDEAGLGAGDLQRLLVEVDRHVMVASTSTNAANILKQRTFVVRGDYGKTALEQGLLERGFDVQIHAIVRREPQQMPDPLIRRLVAVFQQSVVEASDVAQSAVAQVVDPGDARSAFCLIATSSDLLKATLQALDRLDAAAPGLASWVRTQRLLSLHPRIVALAKQVGWPDAACVDGSDDSFLRALQSRG